ncbi:hypothetical protein [Solicola sp. PLA-1-18]
MSTTSPGTPSTPSGDEDPVTDVPDTDNPSTVPPDNPSGIFAGVSLR